jgi:hypothetical protein
MSIADKPFNVIDYWPKPTLTRRIAVSYNSPVGLPKLVSVFSRDAKDPTIFYEDDVLDGKWQWQWIFQHRLDGLHEIGDVFPANGLEKLFGSTKTFRLNPPIFWGNVQTAGDHVERECKYDYLNSSFGSQFGAPKVGKQILDFVARHATFTNIDGNTFSDVIEVVGDQPWDGKTPVEGIHIWLARDVGPVQLAFRQGYKDIPGVFGSTIFSF